MGNINRPNRAFVNVAFGGIHVPLQDNVLDGLDRFGGDNVDVKSWTELPPECPNHRTHNYAFKVWAMQKVIDEGYTRLIWIDCRCKPVKSFDPIWQCIEDTGYYVSQQGDATLGDWTSDAALQIFGIDRAAARTIPLTRGGVVGLNLDAGIGRALWLSYADLCQRGAFNGAHRNEPGKGIGDWGGDKWKGHVSIDPTVGGHRHDESALSYVLWSTGMKPSQDWTNIDVPEVSLIARNL